MNNKRKYVDISKNIVKVEYKVLVTKDNILDDKYTIEKVYNNFLCSDFIHPDNTDVNRYYSKKKKFIKCEITGKHTLDYKTYDIIKIRSNDKVIYDRKRYNILSNLANKLLIRLRRRQITNKLLDITPICKDCIKYIIAHYIY